MEKRNSLHSGWIIVGVSFITLALAYGVWYSFSVFFVALLKEFGWSRSVAAGAFSLFVILHSFVGPLVGAVADRFGPRRVIFAGSLFLGVGLALCSLTRNWWQFYLFFGILTAVGVGSIGWVPNTTIIQRWFKAKRGLAMGIISSGIGIGILVCIPSFQLLITQVGWRLTYLIMGFSIPLFTISMAVLFLKKTPLPTLSDETEITTDRSVIKDPFVMNEKWARQTWTIRQAIATKPFWLLSLSYLLSNIITQSILTHHVAFFVDQGLETLFASYLVGLIGVVSIMGKILWGALSDRIGREVTYTMGAICSICGMISLIIFDVFHFSTLPYFYAFFFGMGYAAMAALPPLITADFFEGQGYGRIFGTLMMLNGVGGAFGAWFAGFLFDQVGSYLPVFVIMIASSSFACLNIWRAAPRKIRMVPGKRDKIVSPV